MHIGASLLSFIRFAHYGEGGIRTLGALRLSRFRGDRTSPLCDLSIKRSLLEILRSFKFFGEYNIQSYRFRSEFSAEDEMLLKNDRRVQ